MDVRLTVTALDDSTVVHVDGELSARAVPELDRIIRRLQGAVVVDLANLLSADDAGVATLRGLAGRGVRVVGASPYVTLLLEGRGAVPVGRPASARPRGRRRGSRP